MSLILTTVVFNRWSISPRRKYLNLNTYAGGNQIGTTQTSNTDTVTNGAFSVQLDFGVGVFNGQDRFLEITVQYPENVALPHFPHANQ